MPMSHVCLSFLYGMYRDIIRILFKTFKMITGNLIWLIHPHVSLWHLSGTKNFMFILKCLREALAIVGSEISKWRLNRTFSCCCVWFFRVFFFFPEIHSSKGMSVSKGLWSKTKLGILFLAMLMKLCASFILLLKFLISTVPFILLAAKSDSICLSFIFLLLLCLEMGKAWSIMSGETLLFKKLCHK